MDDMITGAVELMTLGMGVVFTFLTLLVVATTAMSRIARRVEGPPPPALPLPPAAGSLKPSADPRLTRAIELAIAQHRKRHHDG